jgi:hypothetical protein
MIIAARPVLTTGRLHPAVPISDKRGETRNTPELCPEDGSEMAN